MPVKCWSVWQAGGSTGWAGCCVPQAAVESALEHAGLSDTIKIQDNFPTFQ